MTGAEACSQSREADSAPRCSRAPHTSSTDAKPILALHRIFSVLRSMPSWCFIIGGIADSCDGVVLSTLVTTSTVEPGALVQPKTACRSTVTACVSNDVTLPPHCYSHMFSLVHVLKGQGSGLVKFKGQGQGW